ncbi:MAG: 4Fe-4S binding protein [Eubacteriales bacterium]|nr:4Fe-4S binding protein [Eubacteriales bacterium]
MTRRIAKIDRKKCVGCGACIEKCPAKAIMMLSGWVSQVQEEKCIGCGKCVEICHKHAPSLIEL